MSKRTQTDNTAKSAVIYARFSEGRDQTDVSIEQQVAECKPYAAQLGYTITKVYADHHISGRSDRRPEFQRMLRDAEKGQIDTVIAWKSSRLARNMLQGLLNESKLNDLGVNVLYAKEDFGDNAAGRYARRNMMNMNQFYSENMSEDIKRGMYYLAKDCKVLTVIPFGYRKGEDGRFAKDDYTAPYVQEIFERVLRGDTYAEIAEDLNAKHVKTQQKKPWNKNSFKIMLQNEAYIGVYSFGDVRIEGGMPALIDRDLFYNVQKELKMRRTKKATNRWQKSDFLLTGKLFCGHCLGNMVGSSGTSVTGAKHAYYVCQTRNNAKTCHKKNIRQKAAERLVASAIRNYILQPEVIEWIADNAMQYTVSLREQSQAKQTEAELADVNRGIKNIMAAIEKGIITDTTKDRLLELEAMKRELTERLDLEARFIPSITREQVIAWLDSYRTRKLTDRSFQRELFGTFLEAAYLYDDRLRLIFNYTGETNEVDYPLSDLLPDGVSPPDSSDTVNLGPPHQSDTNYRNVRLYMIRGKFVLDIQVLEEDLL